MQTDCSGRTNKRRDLMIASTACARGAGGMT